MSLNLEVQHVAKKYGDFTALHSTSLKVDNGEFITILGPSGSGKTTLLNIISGFEFPTQGNVFIGENNVTNTPPHKRRLGIMFQSYALFPHLSVYENICFPLKMHKFSKTDMKQKALNALDLVQLSAFKNRFPKQLSGGQQQRVALARAIVFDPPVLLLDEPLGALDKQLRSQMQFEIKNIQERLEITTISVTHDQEEALTMSSRICILRDGEVEQLGTPSEIYKTPNNRFVADFIGETNLLSGTITQRIDDIVILKTSNGELIRAKSPEKEFPEASISIRPEAIAVNDYHNTYDNMFSGVVSEVVYLGDYSRCKVLTEKGEIFQLKLNAKESTLVSKGQSVQISWNLDDGILLEKDN